MTPEAKRSGAPGPKIIGGAWRGKHLVAPPGLATRPTASRARQAVFDILLHAPWGGLEFLRAARVLDVFAGTGAFGLESLSLLKTPDRRWPRCAPTSPPAASARRRRSSRPMPCRRRLASRMKFCSSTRRTAQIWCLKRSPRWRDKGGSRQMR
jgi:hypothetical protein